MFWLLLFIITHFDRWKLQIKLLQFEKWIQILREIKITTDRKISITSALKPLAEPLEICKTLIFGCNLLIERWLSIRETCIKSGYLHIASSVFSIFHKAIFISKYINRSWLPSRGSLMEDGKQKRKQCKRFHFACL